MIKNVNIFASAVRAKLFDSFFKSLEDTSVSYEVVFAGPLPPDGVGSFDNFTYLRTKNIKPAQCYEVARLYCTGEVVLWVADDCEFRNNIVGEAFNYWKSLDNKKAILSIQTKEYYLTNNNVVGENFCDMRLHSFFGGNPNTPRMAPIGMMSREYLEELGGIDRRYICGQWENDIVMRAYADGGTVAMFGDKEKYIDIDHIGKQRIVQPNASWKDFQTRPFARGYIHDRAVLEKSWTVGKKNVVFQRTDCFCPYDILDIRTKSQSYSMPPWSDDCVIGSNGDRQC